MQDRFVMILLHASITIKLYTLCGVVHNQLTEQGLMLWTKDRH